MPSNPGMTRSVMIRSNGFWCNRFSPMVPLSATMQRYPDLPSARATVCASRSSSSTTKIGAPLGIASAAGTGLGISSMVQLVRRQGQFNIDRRAAALFAFYGDAAVMGIDDLFHQVQSQPGAPGL